MCVCKVFIASVLPLPLLIMNSVALCWTDVVASAAAAPAPAASALSTFALPSSTAAIPTAVVPAPASSFLSSFALPATLTSTAAAPTAAAAAAAPTLAPFSAKPSFSFGGAATFPPATVTPAPAAAAHVQVLMRTSFLNNHA